MSAILSRADTETRQLVLTPGDHVTVFSAPATAQDTRFLELSVKPNSKATATIPGDSGWAYGSDANNKNILVDQCDSDPANNSMTLSYQGAPLGNGAYSFLTFIDDGLITYCGEGGGGGGGSNPDHSFTLLINDNQQIEIRPNPVYAGINEIIKIDAYKYNKESQQLESCYVKWSTNDITLRFYKKNYDTLELELLDELEYSGQSIYVQPTNSGEFSLSAEITTEEGT